MQINNAPTPIYMVTGSIIIIYAFLAIFWIKKSMKRKYVDNLKKKEIDRLQGEIDRITAEKETLFEENQRLSSLIHKDNKLMSAMLLAVKNMRWKLPEEEDSQIRMDICEQILAQLEDAAGDRAAAIRSYEFNGHKLPETGCLRIDNLLSYMDQKAFADDIRFELTLGHGFLKKLEGSISTEELETLLADLLENAINATKKQEKRSILLSLDFAGERPSIMVYDSGVPFPEEVKAAWGIRRLTTHADTGGSGIGMMSTYGLCKKCNAQFRITDCDPGMLYTKCISVTF